MIAAPARLIEAPRQAAALLDPLRLRLLENLAEPDSAAGLARRMKLPRQKLNYHLRELERAGLVRMVKQRRKGNCLERLVCATARSYLISPAALGKLAADPSRIPDKVSSAYQVAVAAKAITDLAILQRRADKAGQKLATFTLQVDVRFADAAARNAFTERLATAIAQLAAEYHDEHAPAGRLMKFYLGAYPAITKDEHGNDLEKPQAIPPKGETP